MTFLERRPFVSALCISLLIVLFVNNIVKESIQESNQGPDFSSIVNISDRKQLFFSYIERELQPINHALAETRQLLVGINGKDSWSHSEKRVIKQLANKYHLTLKDKLTNQQLLRALLLMIDRVPPALVMAQAASESAWGTSRFAREANNYFGIWCYTKGCGLIPNQRGQGERHEVKVFSSASRSVAYYVKLLNSSDAYKELRSIRAANEKLNSPITALMLLPGLSKYSERGDDYLKELSSIIRYNKLDEKYPLSTL